MNFKATHNVPEHPQTGLPCQKLSAGPASWRKPAFILFFHHSYRIKSVFSTKLMATICLPGVSKKEVRLIPSVGAQIEPHRCPGTRKKGCRRNENRRCCRECSLLYRPEGGSGPLQVPRANNTTRLTTPHCQ